MYTNYPTKSQYCCCCKGSPMAHINSKLLGKRGTPLGSVISCSQSLLSCAPTDIFFIWDSISGQIILKCEWLHFQLFNQQPANLVHQAGDTLPLQQYNRHPSLCHTPLSCTEFVSWSWALAQGEKKQNQIELAPPPLPGKYSCQFSYTAQVKTLAALWDFLLISQKSLRMIFNSPPAWERTKTNLCGRIQVGLPFLPEASYQITALAN